MRATIEDHAVLNENAQAGFALPRRPDSQAGQLLGLAHGLLSAPECPGGSLSAADAVVYLRTGDAGRVRLKVPKVLKRRFAPIMRGRVRSYGLVVGGFVGGVLIAVLEGVCTGQMYLPTIQYMARTPGLRTRGAVYLLVYNALFVAPLLVILAVALAGVHFRRLSGFLRRHLGGAKLLLALVFFLLAAAMLLER